MIKILITAVPTEKYTKQRTNKEIAAILRKLATTLEKQESINLSKITNDRGDTVGVISVESDQPDNRQNHIPKGFMS